MHTFICAPTDVSAQARADADGLTAWTRVGPDPADVAAVEGHLLFASDWRDTFPPATEGGDGLGMSTSGLLAFLQAAHANDGLTVEVV